jgi:Zn-dependent protease with chaperone function
MLDSKFEPLQAAGQWASGEVAEVVGALLEIHESDLVVWSIDRSTELARWPIRAVRIDALHEGDLAHVECSKDPARAVTTTDAVFLAALRSLGAHRTGLPLRGRARIAIGCAAGVVVIFAGLYAIMPWLSRQIALRVPLDVERRLNPQVQAFFASNTCKTPEASLAVEALRGRLDPGRTIPVDIRIVTLRAPNAFALPGGTVLLTRGLVEEATSADEIAGVLAHEMAHVWHRHVLAELVQNTFMSAVWAATVGDYSGLLVIDPRTVEQVIALRQSREAEAEADHTGLQMMARAGIPSEGLAAFLERNRMMGDSALTFLSTHPATNERIAMIRGTRVAAGAPVLTEGQFKALQDACAGHAELRSVKELFH